jgi:hypothetical protein
LNTLNHETELYTFEIRNKVLLASWSDDLSSESALFRDSITYLFCLAADEKIEHVFLDSGTPNGGTLTEEVVNQVQNAIGQVAVKKIALLESVDFHWDNNLIQFFKYLKSSQNLTFEFKTFYTRSLALDWLSCN